MEIKLKMPKKIHVGYQNRTDTYEDKLGFITFKDNNVLRKEHSWNKWRDKNIEPDIFDNIPTEGFVINKNVGGYKTEWSFKQSKIRVYDPRGFEIEINLENLLHILAHNGCTPGKGLEGEFVYAWDGADLILVSCKSSDYKKIVEYNNFLNNEFKLKAKDVKVGVTYLNNKKDNLVYLGYYHKYNNSLTSYAYHEKTNVFDIYSFKKPKAHFFFNKTSNKVIATSLSNVKGIESEIVDTNKLEVYLKELFSNKDMYQYKNVENMQLDTPKHIKKFIKNVCSNLRLYYYGNENQCLKNYLLFDDKQHLKYVVKIMRKRIDDNHYCLDLQVYNTSIMNSKYKVEISTHDLLFEKTLMALAKNQFNINMDEIIENITTEDCLEFFKDAYVQIFKNEIVHPYSKEDSIMISESSITYISKAKK